MAQSYGVRRTERSLCLYSRVRCCITLGTFFFSQTHSNAYVKPQPPQNIHIHEDPSHSVSSPASNQRWLRKKKKPHKLKGLNKQPRTTGHNPVRGTSTRSVKEFCRARWRALLKFQRYTHANSRAAILMFRVMSSRLCDGMRTCRMRASRFLGRDDWLPVARKRLIQTSSPSDSALTGNTKRSARSS